MSLAPLTIDQFEKRFFQEECPYWFAYNATRSREQVGRYRHDPEIAEKDILTYSWMQFHEMVSDYPYGHLRVSLRKSEKANTDKSPTIHVKWGSVEPQASLAGSRRATMGQTAGGNWQMMQYMMEQQRMSQERITELQMQWLQSQFEVQQLTAALEADAEPTWKEKMMMEGIGAVRDLIRPNIAKALQPQPQGSLGTLGQESTAPTPAAPTPQAPSFDGLFGNINNAVIKLGRKYTHNEITEALERLIDQNPEMADQIIAPYVQQIRKEHAEQ